MFTLPKDSEVAMVVIGLTGGTASGKSTVAAMLAEMGAYVIDADQIARELQVPGSEVLKEIAGTFGLDVINRDGSLNRRALGRICFSQREQLEKLNAIMHPRIKRKIESLISELKSGAISGSVSSVPDAVVIDAAVLFESGLHELTDVVIAVIADPKVQVQRLIARTGLSEEEAWERVRAQWPAEEFARLSDFVIDTTGGVESYKDRVFALYEKILKDHGS
ncbi:MAG: dephospho-CoA kinase [Bacillota bacterium]